MTDMRFHEGQVGSKNDRGDVKLCNCKEARHTILYLDDILMRGDKMRYNGGSCVQQWVTHHACPLPEVPYGQKFKSVSGTCVVVFLSQ